MFVDVGVLNPLLQAPVGPAIPNSGWGHQKLTSPCLVPVWLRLKRLKDLDVTAPMVVKEFIRRRVALLQRHSRPMWALLSSQDHMRFQEEGLPLKTRQTVLAVLTGAPLPDDMPRKSCLLYRCENKAAFATSMPSFDEWGLRPIGLMGSCENPVIMVPLLAAGAELAPSEGVGGRAPTEAGGPSVEEHMPRGDPGASSSGACDPPPEASVTEETRHAAPEAKAPGASGGCGETAPGCSLQPGTPEAVLPSSSSAPPRTGHHVQRFGRLCVDFEELRKRKGSPSGNSIFGPLKRRKYIAIDE